MVTELARHVRQFVCIRQALVRAGARSATVTGLLDSSRVGVVHLDRRGRVLEVNDRARDILRNGDGLSDRDGTLRARAPADQARLERLVGGALPASNAPSVSASILLRRSSLLPPFVVHVKPVAVPQPDYGARHVAALMLIAEPGRRHRISPEVVAATLELIRRRGPGRVPRAGSSPSLVPFQWLRVVLQLPAVAHETEDAPPHRCTSRDRASRRSASCHDLSPPAAMLLASLAVTNRVSRSPPTQTHRSSETGTGSATRRRRLRRGLPANLGPRTSPRRSCPVAGHRVRQYTTHGSHHGQQSQAATCRSSGISGHATLAGYRRTRGAACSARPRLVSH